MMQVGKQQGFTIGKIAKGTIKAAWGSLKPDSGTGTGTGSSRGHDIGLTTSTGQSAASTTVHPKKGMSKKILASLSDTHHERIAMGRL